VPIVRRLVDLDMVDFTTQPRAVNGLFGVTKDDGTTRLILDARPANALFIDPAKVVLPTPDVFANLNTASDDVFVQDRSGQFFHRFYPVHSTQFICTVFSESWGARPAAPIALEFTGRAQRGRRHRDVRVNEVTATAY